MQPLVRAGVLGLVLNAGTSRTSFAQSHTYKQSVCIDIHWSRQAEEEAGPAGPTRSQLGQLDAEGGVGESPTIPCFFCASIFFRSAISFCSLRDSARETLFVAA